MAFHRGNAYLTNVTADNLRTSWISWQAEIDDTYSTAVPNPKAYAKYFNTRNLVIVSFYLTVVFHVNTPVPYTTVGILLPPQLRVRSGTMFHNQVLIERGSTSAERKYSVGTLYVDGETQGGSTNDTYSFLDRIFVRNLGQFVAGQTYTIRGQITFEPAIL